jgi:hypothetical protein
MEAATSCKIESGGVHKLWERVGCLGNRERDSFKDSAEHVCSAMA